MVFICFCFMYHVSLKYSVLDKIRCGILAIYIAAYNISYRAMIRQVFSNWLLWYDEVLSKPSILNDTCKSTYSNVISALARSILWPWFLQWDSKSCCPHLSILCRWHLYKARQARIQIENYLYFSKYILHREIVIATLAYFVLSCRFYP